MIYGWEICLYLEDLTGNLELLQSGDDFQNGRHIENLTRDDAKLIIVIVQPLYKSR